MHILVLYDYFRPLGLSLRRFHCIDELWDDISIGEDHLHQLWDIDSFKCMEAQIKLGEMVKEFEGRDVCIKRIRSSSSLYQVLSATSTMKVLHAVSAVL